MTKEERMDTAIHYCMCAVGGFFGGYAILNRCEVFGSSQTANLIHLIFQLLGRNLPVFLLHLGAVVLYVAALAIAVVLTKRTRIHMRFFSIFVDGVAMIILYCLPKDMEPILALYPIFFATAMQWSVFSGARGFASASIFSTNNVKQTVSAFTLYLCEKEKDSLEKAKFFGGVLLSYHVGVILSYIGFCYWKIQGVIVGFLPLMLAFGLVYYAEESLRGKIRTVWAVTFKNKVRRCLSGK